VLLRKPRRELPPGRLARGEVRRPRRELIFEVLPLQRALIPVFLLARRLFRLDRGDPRLRFSLDRLSLRLEALPDRLLLRLLLLLQRLLLLLLLLRKRILLRLDLLVARGSFGLRLLLQPGYRLLVDHLVQLVLRLADLLGVTGPLRGRERLPRLRELSRGLGGVMLRLHLRKRCLCRRRRRPLQLELRDVLLQPLLELLDPRLQPLLQTLDLRVGALLQRLDLLRSCTLHRVRFRLRRRRHRREPLLGLPVERVHDRPREPTERRLELRPGRLQPRRRGVRSCLDGGAQHRGVPVPRLDRSPDGLRVPGAHRLLQVPEQHPEPRDDLPDRGGDSAAELVLGLDRRRLVHPEERVEEAAPLAVRHARLLHRRAQ